MYNKKINYLLLLSLTTLIFFSCQTDPKDEANQNLEPFISSFQKLYPSGTLTENGSGSFESYTVNSNGTVRLASSTNPQVSWIEFNGLEITDTGVYNLLYSPSARIMFEAIYSTTLDPTFWINQGGNPNQGGVLNIISHNDGVISGNYNITAWYFSPSLNREVGWGLSGSFENIQL
ncbi:hypothetical protein [Winogradskyella flava]|uniref:Uncharacterized protein n=1 Tax=Winogradskyella flava TaxID=1884876 RepID=A0A842IRU2_9FLAO|nr:hypothetical protein [Winogradskyella flava]MBC2845591.1 hypothetical protein [Winogradskyella flava]